jgi:hypothetical protein
VPVSSDTYDDAPSGANEEKTHRECASANGITEEGQKIQEALF